MFNKRRALIVVACFITSAFAAVVASNLVIGTPINILEDLVDWVAAILVTFIFVAALLLNMERHKQDVLCHQESEALLPGDVIHSRSTPVALRRLFAGVSQFLLNDGGYCLRCWLPFIVSDYHITRLHYLSNQSGCIETMIVLCEYCFETCTHEERLAYYGQQYGHLVGKGMQPRMVEWDAVIEALHEEDGHLHDVPPPSDNQPHQFAA